jgi:uncharacterized protein DUF6790
MAAILEFLLGNFTLTFLVVGFIAAAVSLAAKPKPLEPGVVGEAVLAHFILFSIGVSFFYNFVFHVFFGELAAFYIGWADSPFQLEVGFASLGFAAVGFLAFRDNPGLRLGAIVGPAGFLWGAAGGHVYQMVTAHNFAPGNAGVIFYTDIVLPLLGFVLLWLRYRARPRVGKRGGRRGISEARVR